MSRDLVSGSLIRAFAQCMQAQGVLLPARLAVTLQSLGQTLRQETPSELVLVDAQNVLHRAGYTLTLGQPRWQARADADDPQAPLGSLWLGQQDAQWQLWNRSAQRGWHRVDEYAAQDGASFPEPTARGYVFAFAPHALQAFLADQMAPAPGQDAAASPQTSYWQWARTLLRGRVAWICAASFFVNLGILTLPLFSMLVYDKVVFNGIFETLWALVVGVVLFMAIEIGIRVFRARQVERLAQVLDERVDRQLFTALLRPSGRAGSQPGLAARFLILYRDLAGARDFFSATYVLAIADLPFILLMWLVMGLIAWPLLGVAALWTLIYAWGGGLIKVRALRASRAVVKAQIAKQALLTDALSSLDTLRTSHAGGAMFQKFMTLSREQSMNTAWQRDEAGLQQYFSQMVYAGSYLCMICAGAYLVFYQEITVGALVAVAMLSGRTLGIFGGALLTLGRWDELQQALHALAPFLKDESNQPSGQQVLRADDAMRGRISLHQLGHVYAGEQVLQNVELTVPAGQRMALLGRPGSGKSTLARLLAGAIVPAHGEVRVDHVALHAYDASARARWLAFKPQEVTLVAGSLEDNVLLGIAPWATPEQRMTALQRGVYFSGLDQDLERGSLALNQVVEEYGANLSGGQRQKIALARALALPARVLILDEPTNGLDPESENLLVRRLAELKQITLIIVTHSANMLSLTERVVVLEHGRVLADGATTQLVKTKPG